MNSFWQQYQKTVILIVIIFAAFFVYTKLAGPIPFYINSVNTTKTDLFSADGQGEATAVPDTATLDLGITQQSAAVTDAKDKTNKIADKLIADIKKQGISDKDIKTTNYSVTPNYGTPNVYNLQAGTANGAMPILPPGGQQQIVGYTVTQNLEIKIKPIDKANKIIDVATNDGANLVGGVTFTFSDDLQKSLENQATAQAVADAKDKAQNLANTSGIRLGRIVNVVENSNFPRPFPLLAAGYAKTDQANSEPSTNVTPGENTVSVNVVLYYETY